MNEKFPSLDPARRRLQCGGAKKGGRGNLHASEGVQIPLNNQFPPFPHLRLWGKGGQGG